MNSRVDGHTCPSTLDCRFSAGRAPQARARAEGAQAPSPVGARRPVDARLPARKRCRHCGRPQPARSFDSARLLARYAQDDKASRLAALRMTRKPERGRGRGARRLAIRIRRRPPAAIT